jgi:S1-C subfamily serine protease
VTPKSPAAKAGVESGDIVVALNDKDVTDSRHLKLEIARIKPEGLNPETDPSGLVINLNGGISD